MRLVVVHIVGAEIAWTERVDQPAIAIVRTVDQHDVHLIAKDFVDRGPTRAEGLILGFARPSMRPPASGLKHVVGAVDLRIRDVEVGIRLDGLDVLGPNDLEEPDGVRGGDR